MRAAMAMIAAVALLLAAEARARAGSCGGGGSDGGSSDGGGGSGGSGGGDSSSSSDSSSNDTTAYVSNTSEPAQPACVESSDVLGRRQCSGFGTWAMPAWMPHMTVEAGTSVRSISLARYHFDGVVDHGAEGSYAYRLVDGNVGADATLVSGDLRIVGGRRLYGGFEFSIGGVSADEDRMVVIAAETGAAAMQPKVQLHIGGGALVGARTAVGSLTLAGELFAGSRMIQVEIESGYGSCQTTAYARDTRITIEPRAKVDYWLSPWASLGAFAGTDLLARESRVFGVYLGGHTRAFDGSR